jgi:acyl carrier protein
VRDLAVALRGFVKDRLPEYMVPAGIVPLDALPLTPNGKVDRRSLPAWDGPLANAAAYAGARNEREERLIAIWQDVLQMPRVGVHDNFFELGGHSLMATQIVSRVREAFGLEVPLVVLFENPTVAGLATCLTALEGAAGAETLETATTGREAGEL